MKEKTISIITLGCKVNEYESGSMKSQLKKLGYEVFEGLKVADIYILNTCAVTNIAERKSRQMISKLVKLNSDCKIIVTGCASQNNPNQFYNYPNVSSVIGNAGKEEIIEYILNSLKMPISELPKTYCNMEYSQQDNTRKYIKIQDGCNNFCSYCIIPYTKGRSRSRDISDILNEIRLSHASEIVLTGINVSDFRINGENALINLLEEIDNLGVRFRLSSLECVIIDDDFISRLKKLKNFCPFFHLSLQSACNETLKRMNRHYVIEEYISVCNKLKSAFPSACISTDIIVGFKGETDEEFNETLKNLKKIPFAFLHIFPYSVRKGTNAEKLPHDVDGKVVLEREKVLIEYSHEIKNNFYRQNLNTKHKFLVEEFDGEYSKGYTENYIYTYVPQELKIGEIFEVNLTNLHKLGMLGEILK